MAVDVNITGSGATVPTSVVSAVHPARPASVNLQDLASAGTGTTTSATKTVGGHVPELAAAILGRVRVSAVSGTTPTLDVKIQDSWDGTNWNDLMSFAQKTAVSEEVKEFTRTPGPFLRSESTIGGITPSFDFRVDVVGVDLS